MYGIKATSNSKALVVFLLDVSGTMGKPFGSGTRIQVVQKALKEVIAQMVQYSIKNIEIRPRYRLAMIAYSDDVYDILSGIHTIDVVAKKGIPKLEPMNRTDTTKGLRYVKSLIEKDFNNIAKGCPAPLVIHMTDGESTSTEDPEPVVRAIQQITVEDGPALMVNLFVSDELKVATKANEWPGYKHGEDTGNSYANRLLSLSSRLPDLYHTNMIDEGYSIEKGTAMMYPGVTQEFVKMAFVVGTASRGGSDENSDPENKKWEDE